MRLSFPQRLALGVAWLLGRWRPWHRQPKLLGLFSLLAIRIRLRQLNLHDTSLLAEPEDLGDVAPTAEQRAARSPDGRYNDLERPGMGAVGTRFGRSLPFWASSPADEPRLTSPSPREVSRRLLARGEQMAEVPFLNLLAAAWIQFQIHDWVSHGKNLRDSHIEVPLAEDDEWYEDPMRIRRSPPDPTRSPGGAPPTFANTETHWWDGSQIYGSSAESLAELREGEGGRLVVGEDGLLPAGANGVDKTGVTGNYWLGLSALHTLFAREHNAIAEMLASKHPGWSDDRLFNQARLVNAALMAKIHTIEWTPAILPHPTTVAAMKANWYGLSGSKRMAKLLRRFTRSDVLIGIPGSKVDHHGAPYTLTEEFVSVYRLHPLIPDEITVRSRADHGVQEIATLIDASEAGSRALMERHGLDDVLYSLGVSHPGMLQLGNFPNTLRNLTRPDGWVVDLAAVDVMRDRERGVPRYNQFRELIRMPRVRSFEDLVGGDPQLAAKLAEVYPRVDDVDLMVGLYAEPLLEGFGFSETAFRIFVLMASRRLKSDRFFTDDYRPEVYTPEGMRWIEDTDMRDVILRHAPALSPAFAGVQNAFAPWAKAG
jgi:hypothetical protein